MKPTSAVRGTLLSASREQIRCAGLFDAYVQRLGREARAELDQNLAFSWVAIDTVHEHYRALDALALDEATIVRMTRVSGDRVNRVFLTTALRLVRATGITPRLALPTFSKLWDRLYQGGAFAVQEAGANDARVFVLAQPLVRSRYYRIGFRTQCELFTSYCATSVTVREVRRDELAGTLDLVARWS